jgi:hypothetical protein
VPKQWILLIVTSAICILFLCSSGYYLFSMLPKLLKSISASSWPHSVATIVQSSIDRSADGESVLYKVCTRYVYSHNNFQYTNTTIHYMYDSTNDEIAHLELLNTLNPGARLRVSINPSNPSDATLSTGIYAYDVLLPLIFLFILCVSLFMELIVLVLFCASPQYADRITVA